MESAFGRYVHTLFSKWKSGMSGGFGLLFSVVGLVFAVLATFVEGLKSAPVLTATLVISFCVIGFLCLLYSTYHVWREKDQEVIIANEKLKPKLRILAEPEETEGRCRIVVRNLSERTVSFSAQLIEISPPTNKQGGVCRVPLFLPITGAPVPHQEGNVPAGGTALVDVCYHAGLSIGLLNAEYPPRAIELDRVGHEIRICVFPVSPDEGNSVCRSFQIIPRQGPDPGVTLMDVNKADPPD